jgi:hypothetical protein
MLTTRFAVTSPTSSRLTTSQAPQDAQRPHALRIHLQSLANPARTIHPQYAPANAGTKHLTALAKRVPKAPQARASDPPLTNAGPFDSRANTLYVPECGAGIGDRLTSKSSSLPLGRQRFRRMTARWSTAANRFASSASARHSCAFFAKKIDLPPYNDAAIFKRHS